MKVATAQYPLAFHHSLNGWKKYFEKWVKEAVSEEAKILLFPEYGSMELVSLLPPPVRLDIVEQVRELYTLHSDIDKFIGQLSKQYQIIIIAPSFPYILLNKVINRAKVYGPNGYAGYQDKIFMTRFESEDWDVSTGEPVVTVFETQWGNFGIQICYDIEFAVGSKLLAENGADVIFVPSCCETLRGSTRVHIGARARALESQIYTIVSQTVGDCDWSPAVDINYGYTAIYSTPDLGFPDDGVIAVAAHQTKGWLIENLDLKKLDFVRSQGSVFNFKDSQRQHIQLKDHPLSVRRIKIS